MALVESGVKRRTLLFLLSVSQRRDIKIQAISIQNFSKRSFNSNFWPGLYAHVFIGCFKEYSGCCVLVRAVVHQIRVYLSVLQLWLPHDPLWGLFG